MHHWLLKTGCVCLFAGASFACGSAEPVAQQTLAVLGGTETGDDHGSVVYVKAEIANVGGSVVTKVGSGTLLAPNLISTALHVISRNPSDVPFTCDATGHDVSGSQSAQLGPTVAAEKIAIYGGPYPGYEPIAYGAQLVTSGSTTICQNDIAFVVLDRALDLPVVAVHRGTRAAVGDVVTAVGFAGEDTEHLNPRTQRAVEVTAVGQWIRTFTVSAGPCEGDSGGPALAENGELVGVFSSVSRDCTNVNAAAKYTDVSFFAPLVEAAFDAAQAGSPWPTSDGGAGGAPAVEPSPTGAGAGTDNSAGAPTPAGGSVNHVSKDTGCAVSATGPNATGWSVYLLLAFALVARAGVRPRRAR
jgi:hypothetical protein